MGTPQAIWAPFRRRSGISTLLILPFVAVTVSSPLKIPHFLRYQTSLSGAPALSAVVMGKS